MNNVVIASVEQRRDSAIHIHVSFLLQAPLPSGQPHNIEQSTMCCIIVPWLFILSIAAYACLPQTP